MGGIGFPAVPESYKYSVRLIEWKIYHKNTPALQAFLDEHAECRYFSNKDEQKNFEEIGGCKKLEETYNYKSPYWAMRSVGSKSLLGQFCCSACREK